MSRSLAQFEADARRAGFDDVLVRDWAPGYAMAEHAHDYGIQALVVRGDLWLKSGDKVQRCRAGEAFALDPGELHSEGAGAHGAQFWVARRHRR
jgi:quercetin dioxygenase-like cupin family protein